MRYIQVEPSICVQCLRCCLSCSYKMEGFFSPAHSRVQVMNSKKGFGIPLLCIQCPKPPCVEVCPTGALKLTEGVVRLDESKCKFCKLCVDACPIGCIRILDGRVIKCELCLDADIPPCVKHCPTGALKIAELSHDERNAMLFSLSKMISE